VDLSAFEDFARKAWTRAESALGQQGRSRAPVVLAADRTRS